MATETSKLLGTHRLLEQDELFYLRFPFESSGEASLHLWTDSLVGLPVTAALAASIGEPGYVSSTRDLSDDSRSTVKGCRPDFLIKAGNVPIFRLEEKAGMNELHIAEGELRSKSILSTLIYGDFPFNIGVAVAHSLYKFHLMHVGKKRMDKLVVFDLDDENVKNSRMSCISFSYSIGVFLGQLLRHQPLPCPAFPCVGSSIRAESNRYVIFLSLTQYLKVFPSTRPLIFYKRLREALSGVPNLSYIDSSHDAIKTRKDKGTVELKMRVVGYSDLKPQTAIGWLELVRDVLTCLAALHGKGYCHGDVRLANIVYVPEHKDINVPSGWYLIDIEYTCPFADEFIPNYKCSSVLEIAKTYGMSAKLDMFMVGKVLNKIPYDNRVSSLHEINFADKSSGDALTMVKSIIARMNTGDM